MKTYPLFKVHVSTEGALAQIRQVLNSGFINEGSQVTQLTRELQVILNADNLILMNSCTSALTLALHLAGVKPGDVIVSTPMTCVATNTPIQTAGAQIRWADVNPAYGMITPRTVEDAIEDRYGSGGPKPKAVMVVAWAGNPPHLEGIREVCDKHDVKLILDAAHAFDAYYADRPVHRWADYTCYSFQAIKHFTTGDGGALVCRSPEDYRRSKSLKWFGLDRDRAKDDKGNWKGQQWDVDIEEAGYKFNMNNVAAAIGLSQLPHVDHIMGSHRFNAELYDDLFVGFKPVVPNYRLPNAKSSHWVYAMQVDPEHCRLTRDQLLKELNAEGIMAGVVHVPNDDYTCFKQFKADLSGVRQFASRQFNLPCGWWLSEDDIRYIAQRVKELTR
jgi:dTDP-4-amino-4,6-dideoxygalactose transaminase